MSDLGRIDVETDLDAELKLLKYMHEEDEHAVVKVSECTMAALRNARLQQHVNETAYNKRIKSLQRECNILYIALSVSLGGIVYLLVANASL